MHRPFAIAMIAFALGAGAGAIVGGLFATQAPPAFGSAIDDLQDAGYAQQVIVAPGTAAASPSRSAHDASEAGARDLDRANDPDAVAAAAAWRELADSDAVEAPRGDGVIEGAVNDASGQPLAGAVIRMQRAEHRESEPEPSARGRGAPAERGLDEVLRKAVGDYQRAAAARLETTTDGRGEYRFTQLADAPYSLSAYAVGYVVEARGNARSVSPSQRVDFLARAVARVPVRVVLPDGRDARKANLSVVTDSRETLERWTAEDATLLLAPGRYRLRASVPPTLLSANGLDEEAVSEELDVDVASGPDAPEVRLLLKDRLGIRGSVRFGSGISLDQAMIKHAALAPGQAPDLAALAALQFNRWVHGSRPKFEILDLEPGRYVVGLANGWSGSIVVHEVVEIQDRVVDVVLDTAAIDVSNAITVTVLGPDGNGVESVQFSVNAATEHNSTATTVQPLSRGRGVYLIDVDGEKLRRDLGGDTGPIDITVSANNEALGEASSTVPLGRKEVTIRFADPAFADVTILGYRGSPLEGKVVVRLDPTSDSGVRYWRGDQPVSPDGTKRSGPHAPGVYRLSLALTTSQRWSHESIATQEVTLRSGVNRLSIALPVLSRLTVELPAAAIGTVSLSGDNLPTRRGQVTSGQVVFENLAAGEYRVRYHGPAGEAEVQVRVPERSSIALVPVPREPPKATGTPQG